MAVDGRFESSKRTWNNSSTRSGRASQVYVNKCPTRCNHTVYFICKMLYMFRSVSPPIIRAQITVSTASGISQPLLLPVAIVEELRLLYLLWLLLYFPLQACDLCSLKYMPVISVLRCSCCPSWRFVLVFWQPRSGMGSALSRPGVW